MKRYNVEMQNIELLGDDPVTNISLLAVSKLTDFSEEEFDAIARVELFESIDLGDLSVERVV